MSVVLSAQEVMSMAMEIERSGRAYYETICDHTKDNKLKELFRFLADQEKQHYLFFEQLSKTADTGQIVQEDWEEVSDYIKATTDSRFFIGEDKAISLAKKTTHPNEALSIAIGFEKDTLLFFYELLRVTPAKSKAFAEKIVEEEKKHIRMLAEMRKELA